MKFPMKITLDHLTKPIVNYIARGKFKRSFKLVQSVPPFVYSIFNVKYKTGRDYKVPPLNFFRHCATFFRNFFCLQRVPPSIFLIFCSKLDYFQKAQMVPLFTTLKALHFLSFRYSADFSVVYCSLDFGNYTAFVDFLLVFNLCSLH